ncbi:MAG: bifunctional hydroxymethylpyrimidine kinase/phosphomethylpyrimidine kinase [Steroidobacteraceae bacterium]
MRPAVLVIAGTDSSGGAGLTRDVRVLTDFDIDVLCAITAVTAQSNTEVTAVHHVPSEVIRAQIVAAFDTGAVGAIKIGMLGNRATVEAVVESLPSGAAVPIVLDPVLVASSGGVLLDAEGRSAMREKLFPRATVVTPNVPEAAMLLGEDLATDELAFVAQAQRLLALGPQAVLLKGGHAGGDEAVDLLISGNKVVQRIASVRLRSIHRGTGCALASAVAAGLASGTPLSDACRQAKRYVRGMLLTGIQP